MTTTRRCGRTGVSVLLTVLLAALAGCADLASGGSTTGGGAASLKGETIHFVVSYGPGGGYDVIARAIAPYLEKELGATVVVENQDGAGGLVAANQVYSAKPDGTTIGFFSGQGTAGAALGGAEGAKFDLTGFSYVSRVAADPRVLSTGKKSGLTSIDKVRSADKLRFASSGPGGSEHIDATVLFPILGVDGEIITGYEGSAETELAVTSGDTDATSGTLSTRLPPVERGEHHAVLTIGAERVSELPDVPSLSDLDLDPAKRELANAHILMQDMGRMVLAPPNVPKDVRAALEAAFKAACEDPAFAKKMTKAGQPLDFINGAKAKGVAEKVLKAPDAYKALLKEAYKDQ